MRDILRIRLSFCTIAIMALVGFTPMNAVAQGETVQGPIDFSGVICPTCDWKVPELSEDKTEPDVWMGGRPIVKLRIPPHVLEALDREEEALDEALAFAPLNVSNIFGTSVFHPDLFLGGGDDADGEFISYGGLYQPWIKFGTLSHATVANYWAASPIHYMTGAAFDWSSSPIYYMTGAAFSVPIGTEKVDIKSSITTAWMGPFNISVTEFEPKSPPSSPSSDAVRGGHRITFNSNLLAAGGIAQAQLVVGDDAPGVEADTEAAVSIQSAVKDQLVGTVGGDIKFEYGPEETGVIYLSDGTPITAWGMPSGGESGDQMDSSPGTAQPTFPIGINFGVGEGNKDLDLRIGLTYDITGDGKPVVEMPGTDSGGWETISPRISLTYDITGNGKNVVKIPRTDTGGWESITPRIGLTYDITGDGKNVVKIPRTDSGGWETISPRIGLTYDITGDGKNVVKIPGTDGEDVTISPAPPRGGTLGPRRGALGIYYGRMAWATRQEYEGAARNGCSGVIQYTGGYKEDDCERLKQRRKKESRTPNDTYYGSGDGRKKKRRSSFRILGPIKIGRSDDAQSPGGSQWALHRVGFGPTGMKKEPSAWDIEDGRDKPVIVAVIDSGLDFMHPDFSLDNLWVNTDEIPGNFHDDDRNGYVDDVVGWNFVDWNNALFDDDGHGTVVAGIIAASTDNSTGIAGINWGAKVMVLKVSDSDGRTTAFDTAKAIIYAVNNGARVINLSLGGGKATLIEQLAVDYAVRRGVVVVVASGNEGMDIRDYAPAALRGVITVGGTDADDKPVERYNFGDNVFIAAPSKRVFSLRARNTSTLGRNLLNMHSFGPDRAYYIADGTSFAAPIVSGTVSLMLAKDPSINNEQVAWALKSTSVDVGKKGWGPYTGFGRLDALRALGANTGEFIFSRLWRPEKVKDFLVIYGTANAASFASYRLEIGKGKRPSKWETLGESDKPVRSGIAGLVQAEDLKKSSYWTLRITVSDKGGRTSQDKLTFNTKDYF